MRALKETFGCEVCETYGLTEGGANVISPRWGIKKLGSTGLPVPGVEIRIVDPEGERDRAPGEVGELWSHFCGRVDDMISVGGENVYPKEVETILLAHPGVDDVCVVPAPHPVKGEAPVAWVVAREPDSISEEELKQWFLERGPAYAHPRRVFFLDELPVSGTNKLDRKRLEDDARRLIQSSEATRT